MSPLRMIKPWWWWWWRIIANKIMLKLLEGPRNPNWSTNPQMISDQLMRPSGLNLLNSLSSEQDLGGWLAYCFHMICKYAMTNDLQNEMQYAKLVSREEGKFWGVTAAPIQSTVNLSIWIASAFRWSGWRVIEYQEQTNNLHSDGK